MAATADKNKYLCSKCRRTMAGTQFYQYKDGTKCEMCKACLTMHVNNFQPDTFLWILEKFDVPYIENEWNVLRDRAYVKDPYKMNGMTVLGRYLAKMRLKTFQNYTWADNEKLAEEAKAREEENKARLSTEQEMAVQAREAYERGEISEAQLKTYMYGDELREAAAAQAAPTGNMSYPLAPPMQQQPPQQFIPDASINPSFVNPTNFEEELTLEDKMMLSVKWGTLYQPEEWVALEKLYNDFMDSFGVKGAGRVNDLKMLCKTSLKMNQAIDAGDVEAFQKLSRVYDALMKSGKFSEAANKKDDDDDVVHSVGELVRYCEEKQGAIPAFDLSIDKDILDTTIKDLKQYNKTLIYEDKSLAQEIEVYLKKREMLEEGKIKKKEADKLGVSVEEYDAVTDDEIAEFNERHAFLQEQNEELMMDDDFEDIEDEADSAPPKKGIGDWYEFAVDSES